MNILNHSLWYTTLQPGAKCILDLKAAAKTIGFSPYWHMYSQMCIIARHCAPWWPSFIAHIDIVQMAKAINAYPSFTWIVLSYINFSKKLSVGAPSKLHFSCAVQKL